MSIAIEPSPVDAGLQELRKLAAAIQSPWLSVNGAATYTSLSKGAIRNLLAGGKLTAYRVLPGKILVSREELDSYIRSSRASSTPRRGRGRR